MSFPSPEKFRLQVPDPVPRIRLDQWVSLQLPGYSRSEIQHWIRKGKVLTDGKKLRPGHLVTPGQWIDLEIPEDPTSPLPVGEALPLEILYEDPELIAVQKRPGQVVHPAPGHAGGTVLNAMLHRYPELAEVGDPQRPGLVHRLDAGTSGVLLFARTSSALEHLQNSFKQRRVDKTYLAVCHGIPCPTEQRIDLPIGRHPAHRQKRAVNGTAARHAVSRYRMIRGVAGGTGSLLEVDIETGRTHQIRVHLSHAGHPVLGDNVYGGKKAQLPSPWPAAPRIMLHAARLELPHPATEERFRVEAPQPDDMQTFLDQL